MNPPTAPSPQALPEGYADWLAQLKGQIAQHCPGGQFGQKAAAQLPLHTVTLLTHSWHNRLSTRDMHLERLPG